MRAALRSTVLVCLVFVTSFARTGLGESDPVAVSNWAAPPYWIPPVPRARGERHTQQAAIANPSLAFHAVTPCRIADTRGNGFTGPYGPPGLTAGAARTIAVTSPGTSCGIPSGAAAVSFNFAVTTLVANGNLAAYPTGGAAPTVSSLNWTPSEVAISNAAVLALGSDSIDVLVNGPTGSTVDLIIDVNGFYAADPVVTSVNGTSGALSLVGGGDVSVTPVGGTITIDTNATSASTPNTIVRRDASGRIDVGLVAASGYQQPGSGGESLKTIRGFFRGSDAMVFSGTGYTVVRNSIGNYTISFSTPFTTLPTVIPTPVNNTPSITGFYGAYNASSVNLLTWNAAGTLIDFPFVGFIATGSP